MIISRRRGAAEVDVRHTQHRPAQQEGDIFAHWHNGLSWAQSSATNLMEDIFPLKFGATGSMSGMVGIKLALPTGFPDKKLSHGSRWGGIIHRHSRALAKARKSGSCRSKASTVDGDNQVRGRPAKTRVCGALSKMSAGADDEPQAMSHQGTPNLQATAITGEAVVEGVRRLLANTEYLPVCFFRRAGEDYY